MIAPHWNLRKYLVEMRKDGNNPNTRHDARLYVLMAMICHADIRLRCWPSTATLGRETGYNSAAVVEARDWLLEKKAIVLVPHDKRVGDECNLPARQFVYQLTGMMETSDGLQPYLMVAPEVQTQVAAELERLEAEVLQTEVLQTKISVRKTKVLTSSKGSTNSKGKDSADTPNGDQRTGAPSHSQEPDATPDTAPSPEPTADPPAPVPASGVTEEAHGPARLFPSDEAKQPHVAIIDAYHQALIDVGREPRGIPNWYSRFGKVATAMVDGGVTPQQIYDVIKAVYSDSFTEDFYRTRANPITLEEAGKVFDVALKHAERLKPRNYGSVTLEDIERDRAEYRARLQARYEAGEFDDRLKDVA